MKPNSGWLVLALAAVAATSAAATVWTRRGQQRQVAHLQHKAHVKAWENEGGNHRPSDL